MNKRNDVSWLKWVCAAALVLILLLPGKATKAALPPLKEISYYPRNHAWLEFWEGWPKMAQEMDEDLGLIQGLGANTVRIFVHPKAFGYEDDQAPTRGQLDKLEAVIDLIDAHGLQVHVNLFDCWWSWHEIEKSKAWMADIVGPYRDDPRIAVWELQNEVDLSRQVVRDWLQALFPELKQLAGGTPCTVSVLDVEWLRDVQDLTAPATPDLYSLHGYPSDLLTWTTPLAAALRRAKELVGADKLLLGEFGWHTCCFSEDTQAGLYRDVLYTAHQEGIVHLGQWTLYDFPEGTAQCDPSTPASCAERRFGIYHEDGTPKPAAQVLRDAFHGQFSPAPAPALVRNPSFEEDCPEQCGLDNWFPWDERWTGKCWFEQDCTRARLGNCSVRVQGVPAMAVGLYHVPGWPVTRPRYSLEGFAQADGLDGAAWIALVWFDKDGNWLDRDNRSNPIAGTVDVWTRLLIDDVEPPPGAAYAQVFVQVSRASSSARVWFDDITTLVHKAHLPLLQKSSRRGAQR